MKRDPDPDPDGASANEPSERRRIVPSRVSAPRRRTRRPLSKREVALLSRDLFPARRLHGRSPGRAETVDAADAISDVTGRQEANGLSSLMAAPVAPGAADRPAAPVEATGADDATSGGEAGQASASAGSDADAALQTTDRQAGGSLAGSAGALSEDPPHQPSEPGPVLEIDLPPEDSPEGAWHAEVEAALPEPGLFQADDGGPPATETLAAAAPPAAGDALGETEAARSPLDQVGPSPSADDVDPTPSSDSATLRAPPDPADADEIEDLFAADATGDAAQDGDGLSDATASVPPATWSGRERAEEPALVAEPTPASQVLEALLAGEPRAAAAGPSGAATASPFTEVTPVLGAGRNAASVTLPAWSNEAALDVAPASTADADGPIARDGVAAFDAVVLAVTGLTLLAWSLGNLAVGASAKVTVLGVVAANLAFAGALLRRSATR